MTAPPGRIRVGTSGWSYEDWQGVVYPDHPRLKDELRYMAGCFDALEVNASFYRTPSPRTTESWVRRTADLADFRFSFKMNQRFTHQRQSPWTRAEADAFREAITPVAEAGRLGAVLLQFPWSFRAEPDSFTWLRRLVGEFGQWPLVVEVRHDSWTADEARNVLEILKVSYANIDQPQANHCIGPTAHVTGPVGYVRLHGRNREKWFDEKAEAWERYNYLYRDEELDEWVSRIHEISRQSREVYVFTNNHYRGQAPANALQLMSKLADKRVFVPEPLLRAFPFLASVARRPEDMPGAQGRLF